MRTVYLGTSEFAVDVLDAVAATPHRPSSSSPGPIARAGAAAGCRPRRSPSAAALLGIETLQPDDVNSAEARAAIAAADPEAVLICAYGALLKEPLLSEHDMLNVHPSLLPRWRGAAPIERAIEAGDEETGVSIMRPTAEFDAGPVCLQRSDADPARRRLRQPGAAARRARRRAADRDARHPARLPRAARPGGHLRGEDRARGPAARPRRCARASSSGGCARSTRTWARTSSSTTASGSACAARGSRRA